jgi:hypothetical protein
MIPPFGPRLYLCVDNEEKVPSVSQKEEDEGKRLWGPDALLHDLSVIDSVTNVDVGLEGEVHDSRVEVENVRRLVL